MYIYIYIYIAEPEGPQMAIWCMCMTWWLHKATNIHSQYGILTAFPLQQWTHECASMYVIRTYIDCLVVTAVSLGMSRVAVDRYTAH
jgi:hypothetical protein